MSERHSMDTGGVFQLTVVVIQHDVKCHHDDIGEVEPEGEAEVLVQELGS